MEDYLIYEYLKNKVGAMSGNEIMEILKKGIDNNKASTEKSNEAPIYNYPKDNQHEHMSEIDKTNYEEHKHFSEAEAKQLVSNMYHFDNGRKCMGEKFSMSKAMDICQRYMGMIPRTVSYTDLYVAINAQYHDYSVLFKSWFGEDIDHQIIESALVFWFKDDDYKDGCKLWNYFKDK